MGVAGSGKTTIAELVCEKVKGIFVDADDFHPKSNVEKMKKGFGLSKGERETWLFLLFKYLNTIDRKRIVIVACSALSNHSQKLFMEAGFKVIFLSGKLEEIESRIRERKGHFFPAKLLKNQFAFYHLGLQGQIHQNIIHEFQFLYSILLEQRLIHPNIDLLFFVFAPNQLCYHEIPQDFHDPC